VSRPLDDFTIGVEEEYQIVNPASRELRQRAGRILPRSPASRAESFRDEGARAVSAPRLNGADDSRTLSIC
jgi:carboxylate-amine ligase